MTAETEIKAWVDVLHDVCNLIPAEQRGAVIDRLNAERGLKLIAFADIPAPDLDVLTCADRFASQAVLALVRSIANHHSAADAARILFAQHKGPGSGRLADYLPGAIKGKKPSATTRNAADP